MTANRVTTRLFEAADLRAVYAIEEACFEPELRFSRALMRSLAFDPVCRTWMGMVDQVRAGFAIVSLRGSDGLPPTATNPASGDIWTGYIWTIEVLPVFRRLGVARRLLMCVEESAREAGCAAVELHVSERNEDAIALYKTAGYESFGIEPGYYGPQADGLCYRKPLR
jgi:ribosomal protein S18 acetylase RimI-like enzyme